MFQIGNNEHWIPSFGMPTPTYDSNENTMFLNAITPTYEGVDLSLSSIKDITHTSSEKISHLIPQINQKAEAFVLSLSSMHLLSIEQQVAQFSHKCQEWADVVHDLEKLKNYETICNITLLFISTFEPQLIASLGSTPYAPLVIKVIKYSFFAARMTDRLAQLGNQLAQFCKNESHDNALNTEIIEIAVKCIADLLTIQSSGTFKSVLSALPSWPSQIVDKLALNLGNTESIQAISSMYENIQGYIQEPYRFLSDANNYASNYSTNSLISQNHLANLADQVVQSCFDNQQFEQAYELISSLSQSLPMQSLSIVLSRGAQNALAMKNKIALRIVLEGALRCFPADSQKGKKFFKSIIDSSIALNLNWTNLIVGFCKNTIVDGIIDAQSPLYELFSSIAQQSPYIEYLTEITAGSATAIQEGLINAISTLSFDSEISRQTKTYILKTVEMCALTFIDQKEHMMTGTAFLEEFLSFYTKCNGGNSAFYEKLLQSCVSYQSYDRFIEHIKRWRKSKPGDHYIQKEVVAWALKKLYAKSQEMLLTKEDQLFISELKEWAGFANNLDILTPEGQDLLWGNSNTNKVSRQIIQFNQQPTLGPGDFIHFILEVDNLLEGKPIPEDMPLRKECDELLKRQIYIYQQNNYDPLELIKEASSSCIYANSAVIFNFIFHTENNIDLSIKTEYLIYILSELSQNPQIFQLALTELDHLFLYANQTQLEKAFYSIETNKTIIQDSYSEHIEQIQTALDYQHHKDRISYLCSDPKLVANAMVSLENTSPAEDIAIVKAALKKMVLECSLQSQYAISNELLNIALSTIYTELPLDLKIHHLSMQFILNPHKDLVNQIIDLLNNHPNNPMIIDRCMQMINHAVSSGLFQSSQHNLFNLIDTIDLVLDTSPSMASILPSQQDYKESKNILANIRIEQELLNFSGSGSILSDVVEYIKLKYQETLPDNSSAEESICNYYCYINNKLRSNQLHQLNLNVSIELEDTINQFAPDLLYSTMLSSAIDCYNDESIIYAVEHLIDYSGITNDNIELLKMAFLYFDRRGNLEQMQKTANIIIEKIQEKYSNTITPQTTHKLIEVFDSHIKELQKIYAFFDKDSQGPKNEIGLTDGLVEGISQLLQASKIDDPESKSHLQGFLKYLISTDGMSDLLNQAYNSALKKNIFSKEELALFDNLRRFIYKQQPEKLHEMIKAKENLHQVLVTNELKHKNLRLIAIENQYQLLQNNREEALKKFFPHTPLDSIDQVHIDQCLQDFINSYHNIKKSMQLQQLASIYSEENKISIPELNSIQSLCNLSPFNKKLLSIGVHPDPKQEQLIDHAHVTSQEFMYRSSEQRLLGDLAFTNIKRYKSVTQKNATPVDKIISKISAHGHAAIVDTTSGDLNYTHVTDSFTSTPITLKEFLSDDVYKLDLANLIHPDTKDMLKTLNAKLIESGACSPIQNIEDLLKELYASEIDQIFNGTMSSSIFVNKEDRLEFLLTKEALGICLTNHESNLLLRLKNEVHSTYQLKASNLSPQVQESSVYNNSIYDPYTDQMNKLSHQQSQFGTIYNSESLQYNSINILPKQGYNQLKNTVNSLFYKSTKPSTESFADINFEGGMICSSFQMKVTLKALASLNHKLNELYDAYIENGITAAPIEFITLPIDQEIHWDQVTPMKSLEIFRDSLIPIGYSEDFYTMTDVNPKKFTPLSPENRSLIQKGYVKFF